MFLRGIIATLTIFSLSGAEAGEKAADLYWMKIKAKDKFERTEIVNKGIDIEIVDPDFVIALGSDAQLKEMQGTQQLITGFRVDSKTFDFPVKDSKFHDYTRLKEEISKMASDNKDILVVEELGQTVEGRSILNLRISADPSASETLPGIIFMGGHHAREHLSIETPLLLAHYLIDSFRNGDPRIVSLLEKREVNIVPMVNPDGADYDVSTGEYAMWRKNRRDNGDGTFGVDLNRNYGYKWGTGGSSRQTSSDVYMGKNAFSEPETQAIKSFVERKANTTLMLSFHTFSKLILYPWGHSHNPIVDQRDHRTFETMANQMAQWNRYTPMQSSDLYIASGDTTDWAYGAKKIFAFTFELDPGSMWEGGFYPGQDFIPIVFEKNIEPCLYLIDLADNPYRVLQSTSEKYGLQSGLLN